MNDQSRTQGGLICIGAVVVGAWFLLGLARHSYWALGLPVAVLVSFVLGLVFWVGWTIATIRVEPEPASDNMAEPSTEPASQDPVRDGPASA